MKAQNTHGIYHPKWLIFTLTIPQIILIWLFSYAYYIISPILDASTKQIWLIFGSVIIFLVLGFSSFAVIQWIKKKALPIFNSFIILGIYIIFSYLFLFKFNALLSWQIPNYLVKQESFIGYYFTCIMPGVIYALFSIVYYFTPLDKNIKAWKSFLITIAIPILSYVFFTVILPLHKFPSGEWAKHTYCVLIIIFTMFFLAFLIRSIFLLFQKRKKIFEKLEIFWIIIFGIICPVVGLYLNHNLKPFGSSSSGIFGDFSHPMFYILAVLNGTLLALPKLKNKIYRLILFYAKFITLPFTVYFFLIFLPFLPLSLLAIIAIGSGILMLSPLFLGLIHFISIKRDYLYVKDLLPKVRLWIFVVLSCLIIPAGIIVDYTLNRYTLHKALDYIYYPNYQKQSKVDFSISRLDKILKRIETYKKRKGTQTPYLSLLYKSIVLDNLTLGYDKITLMRKIFINKYQYHYAAQSDFSTRAGKIRTLKGIRVKSEYDHKAMCYRTWVHLSIKNKTFGQKEYRAHIELPQGTFISDYYLKINNIDKYGMLVSKKAALWIYNEIVNYRRDPGILVYKGKNKVELRVFPVPAHKVRYTGIQFIHPEPVDIKLNNQKIHLGKQDYIDKEITSTKKNAIYVSAEQKAKLTQVKRRPYYHFILDYSSTKSNCIPIYIRQIKEVLSKDLISQDRFKITLANYEMKTVEIVNEIEKENLFQSVVFQKRMFSFHDFQGGFFLDRTLKSLISELSYKNDDTFPVFVVMSHDWKNVIYISSCEYLLEYYPETSLFYLFKDNQLRTCDLNNKSLNIDSRIKNKIRFNPVVAWPNAISPERYLLDNNEASIIVKPHVYYDEVLGNKKELQYKSALELYSLWTHHNLHPEQTEKNYSKMMKLGYSSSIMSPITSFIVLENEAQERRLLQVQKEVIKGKKCLTYGKDKTKMSEPEFYILIILLFFIFLWKKRPVLFQKLKNSNT